MSVNRPTIAPQIGVSFNGTRRDVLIHDVIASHGAASTVSRRVRPSAPPGVHLRRLRRQGPRVHRRLKGRQHPTRLGRVFPAGHRPAHAGNHDAALTSASQPRWGRRRLAFLTARGPHPRSLSLGGPLSGLSSVASLGPQALSLLPFTFHNSVHETVCRRDAVGAGGSTVPGWFCGAPGQPVTAEKARCDRAARAPGDQRKKTARRRRRRRPRRSRFSTTRPSAIARVVPSVEAMTARHHLRSRVADQGRGDDDQRHEAGGGRPIRLTRSRVATFIPGFERYGKSATSRSAI